MEKNIENGVTLAQINAEEVRKSKKNLEVINQIIGASSLIRTTIEDFFDRYELEDRRFDAVLEARNHIDDALQELRTLRMFERKTIGLCQ